MKVEFRVLQTQSVNQSLETLLNIVINEYSKQKKIAVLASKDIAKQLDDMLWQDGIDSFIPHYCATNSNEYNKYKDIPILVTDNLFITVGYDVLINTINVAINPKQVKLKELKEIVYQDEKALKFSRKKYIYYKKLNLDISTVQNS